MICYCIEIRPYLILITEIPKFMLIFISSKYNTFHIHILDVFIYNAKMYMQFYLLLLLHTSLLLVSEKWIYTYLFSPRRTPLLKYLYSPGLILDTAHSAETIWYYWYYSYSEICFSVLLSFCNVSCFVTIIYSGKTS